MPSRTLASDAKINIASLSDLHSHFDDLNDDLQSPETEHTWQKIERALLHIQAITRGGATKYPDFVTLLKDASGPINNALLSERTKLSGSAGDLLNSIAPRMAEKFEPLVPVFVPTLLLICARTNKIAVKRAEKSLHFIIKHCRPPAVLNYLKEAIKDKGQGLRSVAATALVVVLEHTEKERLTRRVADIEGCIRSGATDSNVEVRQTTKIIFERYVATWPERVESFTKPMTPTIRRYLSLPKTGALVVDVPPLTEAKASRAPQNTKSSSRQEELQVATTHAPPSRAAQSAYNFFPDLNKATSSSTASSSAARMGAGGFSMNDASYGKRGLFAEQIAAARNARLARMPSFNFDDVPKPDTVKRQPSFDQLRIQAAPAPATFRVPRFDVVVAPPSRQDSTERLRTDPHAHGDINATTPSFAAASGLHGKSALLAAYKQAFTVETGSAAKSSSSRGRQHRVKSEKSSRHGETRRERTVAVRFQSDSVDEQDNNDADELLRRSKSAPQIAIDKLEPEPNAKAGEWADSDDDENARPRTPPERILHAQTPKTGVKASRVPAQRVAMPSAVKVSAMRVAVQTPKVGGTGRVASLSADSSPVPKAKAVNAERGEVAKEEGSEKEERKEVVVAVEKKEAEVKEKVIEAATVKQKEAVKEKPSAPAVVVKKPAATGTTSKQPVKSVVAAKSAPSASLAAKARLEARTAVRPASAATTTSTDTRKVAPKTVSAAAKPTVVRKPLTSSSTRTVAKPTAATSLKPKPVSTAKPPVSTASAATARTQPTSTTVKPTTSTSTVPAVKRSSTLTASTASTRNKVVPAATVKKFQPKPSSLVKPSKSSIAVSLKGRVGAKVKDEAVRKAVVSAMKGMERHRRASQVGANVGGAKVGDGGVEGEAEEVVGKQEGEAMTEGVMPVEGEAVASEEVVDSEPAIEPESTVGATTEQGSISAANLDSIASETPADARVEPEAITTTKDSPLPPPICPSTPAKTPPATHTTTATPQTRTPLSSKDTNVPRATLLSGSITKPKSSPLLPTSHVQPSPAAPARTPACSPLRRCTPQKGELSSSFEESDSESDEEEQVVQLQFGSRPDPAAVTAHKVVMTTGKQLVVGLESEDDSLVGAAGEGDETVLLEHAVL